MDALSGSSRRRLWVLSTGLTAVFGCVQEDPLPLPSVEGGQTAVLFALGSDHSESLVVDLSTSPYARVGSSDDGMELVLATYADTPETLHLMPGEGIGPEPDCGLLHPTQLFSSEGSEGEFSAWEGVDAFPDALMENFFSDAATRCSPCTDFDVKRISVPVELVSGNLGQIVRVVAPLDSGSWLFVLSAGSVILWDGSTVSRVDGCSEPFSSAVALGGDQFWMGDIDGRLHRIEVNESTRTCKDVSSFDIVEEPGRPKSNVHWMLPDPAVPDIIYVLTSSATVYRFDGQSAEEVAQLPLTDRDEPDGLNAGGMLWSEEDNALMIWTGARWIGTLPRDGELRLETLPEDRPGLRIRTIIDHPTLGHVVLASLGLGDDGWLYVRKSREQFSVLNSQVPGQPKVIVPFRDGILAGGVVGVFEYIPDFGVCEPTEIIGIITSPRLLLPISEDRFFFADAVVVHNGGPDVLLIEPKDEPQAAQGN